MLTLPNPFLFVLLKIHWFFKFVKYVPTKLSYQNTERLLTLHCLGSALERPPPPQKKMNKRGHCMHGHLFPVKFRRNPFSGFAKEIKHANSLRTDLRWPHWFTWVFWPMFVKIKDKEEKQNKRKIKRKKRQQWTKEMNNATINSCIVSSNKFLPMFNHRLPIHCFIKLCGCTMIMIDDCTLPNGLLYAW